MVRAAQCSPKRGARQLWMGRPAKHVRDLDDQAIAANQAGVKRYVVNGRIHAEALGLKG